MRDAGPPAHRAIAKRIGSELLMLTTGIATKGTKIERKEQQRHSQATEFTEGSERDGNT